MKKILITITACLLIVGIGYSQEKAVTVSSKKYDKMAYSIFAEKANSKANTDRVTSLKMGNSYRLNGKSEEAASWYEKATADGADAESALKYAQALLESGDCEGAMKWYGRFTTMATPEEVGNRNFITDCGDFKSQKYFGSIDVKAVKGINSNMLDFSPVPVDGGIVFTSSRAKKSLIKYKDGWTNMSFTDLYLMEKDEVGGYSKAKRLFKNVNRKFHDGTAVFAGSKMFFTRNNLKGKGPHDLIDLKIYTATNKGGDWVDAEELPFNSDEFATCHPTLTADGQKMIFSSNRPGGQGGMDLWMTEWNGSAWGEPTNLGEKINSSDNEIFPFLDKQDRLFFSSNGWAGLGGLDLFTTEFTGANWSNPENLGSGMNSSKDDFGIWVSEEGDSGYFSSNRLGGMGGDDIYEWKADGEAPAAPKEAAVIVVDALTREPIDGATVDWAEVAQKSGIVLGENNDLTKPDGMVKLKTFPARTYAFNVKKEGYQPKNESVSIEKIAGTTGMYEIPLEKVSVIEMTGLVTDAMTGNTISGADVRMKNLCDDSAEMFRSNASGNFNFETSCGCKYEMIATKNGYTVGTKTITKTCAPGEVRIALANEAVMPSAPVRRTTTTTSPSTPISIVTTRKVGDVKAEYYEGQVLILHDVYYDFDKWFIRTDAAKELDHLVGIMKDYPSMEIELGSHTDARGRDSYNRRLSQKRADAAVNYIISKGISKSRIVARGYGETVLRNHCANGVKCEDKVHEENRRTEVRVTAIRGGVDVRDEH